MGDQLRKIGKVSYQLAGSDPKTRSKDIIAALREQQKLIKETEEQEETAVEQEETAVEQEETVVEQEDPVLEMGDPLPDTAEPQEEIEIESGTDIDNNSEVCSL